LALGIGANTAVFSVLDAVLLRRLPFPDPDRLVRGYGKFPRNDRAAVSPPDFVDFRAQNRTFQQFAAMAIEDSTANLTGSASPEQVRSNIVSWNFFDALGVQPKLGRSFLPIEEQVSEPQVAILGYGIWQRDFGGDPGIVGHTLTLDAKKLTIVGVLPSDLALLSEAQVWLPMPMLAKGMTVRRYHFLSVVGRLNAVVSQEQAQTDLDTISRSLAQKYPESNTDWSLHLVSLREVVVGPVRPTLWLLFSAVGMLLLIACANVSNLLLARVTARQKEIAVRAALGASRWRIVRQVITESTLLSLAGGALAAVAAVWGVSLLRSVAPADLPRIDEIQVNASVLLFTVAISMVTGVFFGVAPALQLSSGNLDSSLKLGGRNPGNVSRHRLGRTLMVFEIAISFALLVGAGLLVKSVWRVIHVDPGFRSEHVATARISLSEGSYQDEASRVAFFQKLEQQLSTLPGVESAGAISELPLNRQQNDDSFRVQGRAYGPNESEDANLRVSTTGYLSAMSIPLFGGRWFDEHDSPQSPRVVVVNQPFVKRYFAGQDPIGKSLLIDGAPGPTQIVGIIGGVSHFALDAPQPPEMYLPLPQAASGSMNLVVRAVADPEALASAMRDVVRGVDSNETLSAVRTMDEVVQTSVAQQRFSAVLLALFSIVAMLLAAVGLYGVIAYVVTQRTQEIGIRMSLGANPGDVLRLVLGDGARLALIGSAAGLVAALVLSRLVTSLLYEVTPTDPVTFISVFALLTSVALLACYLPARRAARVDPMVALRHD
jgi:putative ABC transport system permease protein